jgi:ribosomal protein S18 acetylase RimI-like enzyme
MIRRAAPKDADQIAETFNRSIGMLTFLPPLHTEEDNRRFITEMVPVDHEIWVAEEDGCVVGLAAVGDRTLGHLYVHPDHQSRGIGSQLLEKVKALRPEGFTLWTFPNNERACRFYERHGMHVSARGDGSGNEEGLPDVQYEWLPEGATP